MSKKWRTATTTSAGSSSTSAGVQSTLKSGTTVLIRKYGWIFEALADALQRLSFDLVSIIADYVVHGTATPEAQPKLLFSIGTRRRRTKRYFYKAGDFEGACYSIASTADGQLVMSDFSYIKRFSHDGKFLEQHRVRFPIGIAVDCLYRVFVASCEEHAVVVYTLQGKHCRSFGHMGGHTGEFFNPYALAIDDRGILAVCDAGNNRVQLFIRDGLFLRAIGSFGKAIGQFSFPKGVVLNFHSLFVVDSKNERVQVFDLQGRFLRKFTTAGAGAGIALDRVGNVFVCCPSEHCVQVFSPMGKLITTLGVDLNTRTNAIINTQCTNEKQSLRDRGPLFFFPLSVQVDRDDRVFVGDKRKHVLVFSFA